MLQLTKLMFVIRTSRKHSIVLTIRFFLFKIGFYSCLLDWINIVVNILSSINCLIYADDMKLFTYFLLCGAMKTFFYNYKNLECPKSMYFEFVYCFFPNYAIHA